MLLGSVALHTPILRRDSAAWARPKTRGLSHASSRLWKPGSLGRLGTVLYLRQLLTETQRAQQLQGRVYLYVFGPQRPSVAPDMDRTVESNSIKSG